ncbi:hypothetical protein FNV43_RR04045 [Rhamnella rubrinervis]|uniref:Arf-GAP domain-containing protein n=1 Tax=Rhamnella rubrinervis TaxID=2594499 RepID=A0A8K0MQ78_9ROSA|nr:hypothetical protein FNV43_RR04045 [Rhamnella rubrinervis]
MNEKANVTKELNARHRKVRSVTLDTWLPEQVAFIQSMGNEKANSYWEAELPPNYDRVGIENFIRAKYEDKRWVRKDGKPKSPSRRQEEKASTHWQRSRERSDHSYTGSSENLFEERKSFNHLPKKTVFLLQESVFLFLLKDQNKNQKDNKAEVTKQAADTAPAAIPPKVDFATDLFNMLSRDGPNKNGLEAAPADDNSWAAAEEASTAGNIVPPKPVESNTKSTSGIEDLFTDSPLLTPPVSQKPQKDVKNDIMSLFEKMSNNYLKTQISAKAEVRLNCYSLSPLCCPVAASHQGIKAVEIGLYV